MATKSKVTALSLKGNQVAVERDGKVRDSKIYHLTLASLARVRRVIDNLPWQNSRFVIADADYLIAENADIHPFEEK